MENTMTKLNFATFKENYNDYKEEFDEGVHPEFFYVSFYDEFIKPVISTILSDEDKKEWIEALDEDEIEGKTFEEVLEDYDYLGEDITGFVINSDEPKCAELKEKFIEELFKEMTKQV